MKKILEGALLHAGVILICLSTMFIKQHSAMDALVALPVCLLAEGIVYGRSYWHGRLKYGLAEH